MISIKGKSAAPGIVLGKALLVSDDAIVIRNTRSTDSVKEFTRLDKAVTASKRELDEITEHTRKEMGDDKAQIFESHALMVEDEELLSSVRLLIETEKMTAEAAYQKAANAAVLQFGEMSDLYLRERAADVRDVSDRVLRKLTGQEKVDLSRLKEPVILIAHDLTPSQTAMMDKKNVLGFLTNIGGKTSHTAIMARTLEIPAVLGLKDITSQVKSGDSICFNGATAEVFVSPTSEVLNQFRKLKEEADLNRSILKSFVGLESVTRDQRKVKLMGNIGTPEDIPQLLKNDAEGVGLYRTEFLFMDRTQAPTEDEQFEAYKVVLQAMKMKQTVIRTLDVGGDKKVPYIHIGDEENPFLGNRAVRYCLNTDTELFKTQLRALLRASVYGRLAIMFPMISSLEEVMQCKELIEVSKIELKEKKIPYSDTIEVGIMIEIPSAAVISDVLAKHVDFMSIGTNDLIQYTCAVDRMNEKVSDLYDSYHPAVLRLIAMVIKNAHHEGIWAGMCGEMAGQADLIPVLLGFGLREFSMSPTSVLKVRKLIRSLTYEKCQAISKTVLTFSSGDKIRRYLKSQSPELE